MSKSEIHVELNRAFASGGGRDLKCDIYTPGDLDQPAPAVLIIHGGGWRSGSKDWMAGSALHLAGKGYVCIANEYRLNTESTWPAQIEDVKAAIRWIRAHADSLGVNPDMICLQGHSAGAHLSLHAAGTANQERFSGVGGHPGVDESVAATAVFYAPVRFSLGQEELSGATPLRALLGHDGGSGEEARKASPIEYVSAQFPPTLLLHGTADKVVRPSASMRMYEALSTAGAEVELHMLSHLPHGFARRGRYLAVYQDEIDFFLQRTVLARDRSARELQHSPR
ncbi:MAG: alpha/beta hydrolase [Pseudomonadales bacterium]|jgi:acetyl esterase/lipase|nr:alpha/beta hydrolase [Pseudomonadales bacterium]MDP7358313.1 alpha/beta hydrolase [Pseudomonadales bacterium]MDP7597794.1 alpha/beta hydrolase [Pseudomonadales bacterium]HJN52319.1 alpha/beta hydrolase [Pseudomonadales bacterium]|tara:strand:- start:2354 stop:3199 length:846 start_codon:yes stop_codon:yes gene_type:complete